MATGTSANRCEVSDCQRCRKLKVGCDKAKPACRRCIKAGMRCVVPHAGSNKADRASTNCDKSILTEEGSGRDRGWLNASPVDESMTVCLYEREADGKARNATTRGTRCVAGFARCDVCGDDGALSPRSEQEGVEDGEGR